MEEVVLLVLAPPTVSTVGVVLMLLDSLVPVKIVVLPDPSIEVFGPFPVTPLPGCVVLLLTELVVVRAVEEKRRKRAISMRRGGRCIAEYV